MPAIPAERRGRGLDVTLGERLANVEVSEWSYDTGEPGRRALGRWTGN